MAELQLQRFTSFNAAESLGHRICGISRKFSLLPKFILHSHALCNYERLLRVLFYQSKGISVKRSTIIAEHIFNEIKELDLQHGCWNWVHKLHF